MKIKYFLFAILLCLAACTHEDLKDETVTLTSRWSFSVGVDDLQDAPLTKSALTADDIETRITDVTLAVYNDETGALCGETVYATSDFDDISVALEPAESFTVYVLANMGDMRAAFPATCSLSALEAISYRIPGYTNAGTGLNDRGLPMAGTLSWSAGDGIPAVIPLTRLAAKLQASLSCEWPGRITSVKVYNLNAVLHPFGVSAAQSPDDLLSEQEIGVVDDGGVKSGSFVFYLPENRQGTVDAIGTPADKDYGNPSAVAKKDLASYLEAVVTGEASGGADGTLTYRSYLGGNSTSDFNILRNSRYTWTVRYLPDNMQNNDWKHENQLSWKVFTYIFSSPDYIYLGQEDNAILYKNAQNYRNGTFVGTTYGETIPSVTYSLTPDDNSVLGDAHLTGGFFSFTGKHPGEATVSATAIDPYHPDGISHSKSLRVLNYRREVFIRTPSGVDYYDGETLPVPFGSSWTGAKVGMRKTLSDGTVQTVCPVVCEEDNLGSVFVEYNMPATRRLFDYAYYNGDAGKSATFDLNFNNAGTTWTPPEIYVYLSYRDYNNKSQSIQARIYPNVTDVDTELINISSNRESAYWAEGQSIELEAAATAVHNGATGSPSDITSSGAYTWTVSGAATLTLSGGKRVVTASGAGDVTVTVTKKSDSSVSASKTLTFLNRVSYRLALDPAEVSLEKGATLAKGGLTLYKDRYVNGTYQSREAFDGASYWLVRSGSSCISISGSTLTATAVGTGHVEVYTYDAEFEPDHRNADLTVHVTEEEVPPVEPPVVNYAVTLSPDEATGLIIGRNTRTFTASATRDGSAASDGVYEWTVSDANVLGLSGTSGTSVTVSGLAPGSGTITVNYKVGGTVVATATSKTVGVYRNGISLSASPASVAIGGTSTPTVTWTSEGPAGTASDNVTSSSSCTLKAYTGASGSTESAIVSIDAGSKLVTGLSSGICYLEATYTKDGYSYTAGRVALAVAADVFAVTVSPSSAAILVDGTQAFAATVTKNGAAYTPAAGTLTWTSSDNTVATVSGIGTGATATGRSAGTATITAVYDDGAEHAEASAQLTVSYPPLLIEWSSEGAPTYVAQRGRLDVSGLVEGETLTSFEAVTGAEKVVPNPSGNSVYVGLIGAGSATLRGTTSLGRTTGNVTVSATAPLLRFYTTAYSSSATFYAHPDGSVVTSDSSAGLDDGTKAHMTVRYLNTAYGPMRCVPGGAGTVTVGATDLASDLYETYLAPVYAPSSAVLHAEAPALGSGTVSAEYTDGVYVQTLNGYPSSADTEIGTVTVSAKGTGSGVDPITATIRSVDVFKGSTVTPLPDEHDYALVSRYVSTVSTPRHVTTMEVASACAGVAVRDGNGNSLPDFDDIVTSQATGNSAFTVNYDVMAPASQAKLVHHYGGEVFFDVWVENRHSHEKMYRHSARFNLFVHGVIGARMTGLGTNTVTISTAFCGDEENFGFGSVANMDSANLVGTDYTNGQAFGYIPNTIVTNIPAGGSPLNSRVYQLYRSDGTLNYAAQIMEAEKPHFIFLNIGSLGVFINEETSGYYYLQPTGTGLTTDSHGTHGFFVLHLLEQLDGTAHPSGPRAGWILDE